MLSLIKNKQGKCCKSCLGTICKNNKNTEELKLFAELVFELIDNKMIEFTSTYDGNSHCVEKIIDGVYNITKKGNKRLWLLKLNIFKK